MGTSEVTSGRSAPLPARPRAGARLRGLLDRRRVGPATWFPADDRRGEPGFLWKKAGGKTPGREEVLPPWTPLWLGAWGGFSIFETGLRPIFSTPVTARPPAGRAGGGGFADGKGPSTRKAFPLGGKVPQCAHTGADEGAILYPTFPCRKRGLPACRLNGFFCCSVGQAGRPLIRHLR